MTDSSRSERRTHMEFRLPEIGEGLYEAELSRWLVESGAAVKPGQGLLEVLTDKATMEVPAPFAGTVGKLLAEPGQTLKVGQPVLTYEGTTGTPLAAKHDAAEPAAPQTVRREANGTAVP